MITQNRSKFVSARIRLSTFTTIFSTLLIACLVNGTAVHAQESADSLSQQLANPLASLISVPIQNNFDFRAGPDGHGFAYTANIQPVIPFSLNNDWNLITRTIIPIAYRDYVPGGDVTGLGDINASFFFSPKAPGPGGLIWGLGPVLLLPSATSQYLGGGKFGAGLTGVALVQNGPWTVGALTNHVWSVAGPEDRQDISATLLQPFVSYNFGHGTSVSLSSESNYDWVNRQWLLPINLSVSQVFQIGTQAMSFQIGGKYLIDRPTGAPSWGIRTTLTFLFPKK